MRKAICGLFAVAALVAGQSLTAPEADAAGPSHSVDSEMMPKLTFLSRSFRWQWDPFRVEGDRAYAVAWITNNHRYTLTLKTFCRAENGLMRSLSGRHLIEPGQTLHWDTRHLVRKAGGKINTVVKCKFWVDGSVDLRGQIVNNMPARMGREGNSFSLITFNYANFGRKKEEG